MMIDSLDVDMQLSKLPVRDGSRKKKKKQKRIPIFSVHADIVEQKQHSARLFFTDNFLCCNASPCLRRWWTVVRQIRLLRVPTRLCSIRSGMSTFNVLSLLLNMTFLFFYRKKTRWKIKSYRNDCDCVFSLVEQTCSSRNLFLPSSSSPSSPRMSSGLSYTRTRPLDQ